MAGLFQVLWGKKDGTFKKAAVLEGTDREPLIIPIKSKNDQTENICTRPFAVDWTGSGHLDLVVGNFTGTFYRFVGEGAGKFNPRPEPILTREGLPLRIKGAHADPFVIDWDGDGDLDVLSGSSIGGVQWAENTAGQRNKPALEQFKALLPPGTQPEMGQLLAEEDLSGPTTSTRVWVSDLNEDGKLDLLVGDSVTLVSMAKGITKDQFARRFKKWKAAMDDGQKKGAWPQEAYNQRTEFMVEDRTGYVWAYLQK